MGFLRRLRGFLGLGFCGWVGGADVEWHEDVGAESELEVDDGFWGEVVFGAVEMGLEGDAFWGDFSHFREGEYLKASGVGENGFFPVDKFVESSCFLDEAGARAE